MKKTVIAAAVAGAFIAPAAMAQTSSVQIGGSIHLIYGIHNPNNPSGASKSDNMHTFAPQIHVRGEEKLGGGLSAWFQCASSFDITGQRAADGSGQLCGRNSAIGFKGGWGNLFAGIWDMPHKINWGQARGWWSSTSVYGGTGRLLLNGSASNTPNGAGFGAFFTGTGAATSFHRRQNTSVNYHSPRWGGFEVKAAFSASNEQTGLPEASGLSPRLFSVSGGYRGGPFYVGASYERHEDYNPIQSATYTGGSDDSWALVGVYTFANSIRISGTYVKNEYESSGPAVGDTGSLEVDGFALYLDWRIAGPHSFKAQYGQVDDSEGTPGATVGNYTVGANTGGNVWGLAYAYDLSKRTQVYLAHTRIKNDSGTDNFSMGLEAATDGGKQTFTGIGVRHRF